MYKRRLGRAAFICIQSLEGKKTTETDILCSGFVVFLNFYNLFCFNKMLPLLFVTFKICKSTHSLSLNVNIETVCFDSLCYGKTFFHW